MSLGYEYRPDGMFLVRWTCAHCGESQETIALAQHRIYCQACDEMMEWERTENKA